VRRQRTIPFLFLCVLTQKGATSANSYLLGKKAEIFIEKEEIRKKVH
jgi:hypothetical protein